MVERQKIPLPPTSFSPVASTNVGISSQIFWLLFLALLAHWRKISSLYLVPVPNYWTSIKTTPQKMRFIWSNLYKIEVVITSLIDRNARITKLWSHEQIYNIIWIMWWNFVGDVIERNYDVITIISKYCYFKKAWGSHFCWHHQNYNQVY